MFIDPGRKNAMVATGYDLDDRDGSLSRLASGSPAVALYYRSSTTTHGAFTLLEITLAVAILGMMSLAIFRFVQSNLTALRVSSDANAAEAQYDGLRDLLTAEWQSLSPRRAGM